MPEQLGASSNILMLPPSGAAPRGIGEGYQSDLYSGNGSFDVPILLPAAQNGFAPELSLRYSTNAGVGAFGQGWAVPLLQIQRSTRFGVPKYGGEPELFSMAGADDLVAQGQNLFRSRIDTLGWRVERTGDAWTVTSKDGLRHRLGATPNSRIEDGARIFAWLVDEIATPTGQSAKLEYVEDDAQRLLSAISYGPFKVLFTYEDASRPYVSRRAGFAVPTLKRCNSILVTSDRAVRERLREYQIFYRPGDDLISRVRLTAGAGDEAVAMPDLHFNYTTWSTADVAVHNITGADLPDLSDDDVDLVDLEGTGRPGLLMGTPNAWRYWPNRGDGAVTQAKTLANAPSASLSDPLVQFADLEGNGTADMLIARPGRQGFFPNAAGGRWEPFNSYNTRIPFALDDPNLRLYDTDGDGRVDAVLTGPNAFRVFYNLGRQGWSNEALTIPRLHDKTMFPDISFSSENIFTADMSGDGLTDIVELRSGVLHYWPYLGHGRWGKRVEMSGAPVMPGAFDPSRFRLIDVDGDGAADLVFLDQRRIRIWFNEGGARLSRPFDIEIPQLGESSAVAVDFLSTGRAGLLLCSKHPATGKFQYRYVSFGAAYQNGFMSEILTDLGHSTKIAYQMSSAHRLRDEKAGAPWRSFMPFSAPVVTEVRTHDGPANITGVTRYRYSNGHYDGLERAFNGFGSVAQDVDGDEHAPGVATSNDFHSGTDLTLTEAQRRAQGVADRLKLRSLRGSPLRTATSEIAGGAPPKLISQTSTSYGARLDVSPSGLVATPYSIEATTDELGGSLTRRTIVRRGEPDAFGNPTWTEREAGVIAKDEDAYRQTYRVREEYRYALPRPPSSSQHWLAQLRCEQLVRDCNGQVLSCERIYYDGADFIGLSFGDARSGKITRIEELVFRADQRGSNDPDLPALGYHYQAGAAAPGWYRNRMRNAYNAEGLQSAVMDAQGHIARIQYDSWNIDPIRVEDPCGLVTSATYDHSVEMIASLTQPGGAMERRTYDALGRTRDIYSTSENGDLDLAASVFLDHGDFAPGGARLRPPSVTTLMPRISGQTRQALAGITENTPDSSAASFVRRVYSASGLELALFVTGPQTPGGETIVRTGARRYDCRGEIAEEEAPEFIGSFASNEALRQPSHPLYARRYDAVGREIELRFPTGARRHLYNPFETLVSDANTIANDKLPGLARIFDAAGRMIETRQRINDELSHDVKFAYSPAGRLTEVHDHAGLLAQIQFDCAGRKTEIRHRDAGRYQYIHDASGALCATLHPSGGTITYAYDANRRLISAEEFSPGVLAPHRRRFFYDASPDGQSRAPNRLCAVEDDAGLTTHSYAANGWLIAKTRVTLGGKVLKLTFERDFHGHIVAVVYPNGVRVAFEFGAAGELSAIDGIIERIEYDPRGRPTAITQANGVHAEFAYGVDERLAKLDYTREGASIASFSSEFDAGGNPTRKTATFAGAPRDDRYLTYDDAGRLIASHGERGGAPFRYAFAYDVSGNMLRNEEHSISAIEYGDATRPGLATTVHGAAGAEQRTYDAAGRLTSNARFRSIDYDLANRMRRTVHHNGAVTTFHYDHAGRRCLTQYRDASGAKRETITFDDMYDETGAMSEVKVTAVGGVAATIFLDASNRRRLRFEHQDDAGNIRFSTDAEGVVSGRRDYTSFGLETSKLDLVSGFSSKTADVGLGLVQFGSRFYEPLLGRFTTPDILLLESPEYGLTDPETLNLYAYGANSPHRFYDPKGRFPWLIIAAVVIGAVIGHETAKENNQNPLVGALIGGLVGGIVGVLGLTAQALTGAAMGAISSGGNKPWTGAAVGFVFGATQGAASSWLPAAGDGAWTKWSAGMAEIGADALLAGAQGGVQAHLSGGSFESGFRSGFVFGAAFSALKVAALGARTSVASATKEFEGKMKEEWARQSKIDHRNYLSAAVNKAGMPDASSVVFRTGGLIQYFDQGRSFTLPNSIHLGSDIMAELKNGAVRTLTHELRHIAQQRAANLGFMEMAAVWLFQAATSDAQYHNCPCNNTLEPNY